MRATYFPFILYLCTCDRFSTAPHYHISLWSLYCPKNINDHHLHSAEAEEASKYLSAQIHAAENRLRKSGGLLSIRFGGDGLDSGDDEPDIAGSAESPTFKRVDKRLADLWSGGQWEGVQYKAFMQHVIREDPDFTGHISAGNAA